MVKIMMPLRCSITSAFEHHAIMHSMAALERLGFEVTYIKPTTEGYIRPEDVEAAIRPDTALISIMMANNEIGTIPVSYTHLAS